MSRKDDVIDATNDSLTFTNLVELMRVVREMAMEIDNLRKKIADHEAVVQKVRRERNPNYSVTLL